MKKTFLIIFSIIILMIIVTTFFVFMKDDEKPPDIVGYVFSIESNSFLVADGIESDHPYDGDIDRLVGDAFYFSTSEDTVVFDSYGDEIDFIDIDIHDEVKVWIDGPVMESYPAQAEAVKIKLSGETFSVEDAVSFTCDDTNKARLEVIEKLKKNWSDLEQDISQRPSLGSEVWSKPYHVQFIGNDHIMIAFEDGHVILTAVFEFKCREEGLVEDFVFVDNYDFPLEEQAWNDLREEFGNLERDINTYTSIPVYTEGVMIEVDDWEEIDSNVFILDLGEGKM